MADIETNANKNSFYIFHISFSPVYKYISKSEILYLDILSY